MNNEDGLTQQIWDGLLDTDRAIRYCDKLARKSLRWHPLLSGGLVAASCGVAMPLLSPLLEFPAETHPFPMPRPPNLVPPPPPPRPQPPPRLQSDS